MTFYQAGLILYRAELHPRASDLSGSDRLVLACLFSFAADDDQPVAYASKATLAGRTGLARSTVQDCLKHLESVGVMCGEHRNRRPTRWTLDPFFAASTRPGAGLDGGPGNRTGWDRGRRLGPVKTGSRSRLDREPVQARPVAGLQGTEVSDGAKRRNERKDLIPVGSAASDGSSGPAASATPPPPDGQPTWTPPGVLPPGVIAMVNGVPIGPDWKPGDTDWGAET